VTETTAAPGRQPVAVVATGPSAARSAGIATELRSAGHEVMLVVPEGLEVIAPAGIETLAVSKPALEVTPPYLLWSYAFYRQLSQRDFAAIVFDLRGGHAYCAARAKQVGTAFASTTIVVDCSEPTLFGGKGRRPFLSKHLLGVHATERLALELADAFFCGAKEVEEWLGRAAWSAPSLRLPLPTDGKPWPLPAGEGRQPHEDQRPLVAVVIAFHERTTYLHFCLDALARQTHSALEVIVADDGSQSAAARELLIGLERRSWPWRFRVLRLQHGGLGATRNAGWRAATAELVLFIDDDDVAFDELVETLVRARAVAGADVVVAGARFFRGRAEPRAHDDDVVRISLCQPRELGVISNQYGGPVNLWRREWLERLDGFRAMPTEDWDLLSRATLEGARLTTPPDPLYWYRQTPGSMYSADPFALRDAALAVRAEQVAKSLPSEWRLLPHLAAGAYSELERRKLAAQPRWRQVVDRGRLLARRARQVGADEGIGAVGREAVRFARRGYDRRR
jgi:Glycosyl transferase family 2